MPRRITLDHVPAGYAAAPARDGGDVPVVLSEFTSSEDGDLFISRLEGYPSIFLSGLPADPANDPAGIKTFLAVLPRPGDSAIVFVNEAEVALECQAKRTIQNGEGVRKDDITDIRRLAFPDVEVPPDAGILFLFSVGWRKGLYFDFEPLHSKQARPYDLQIALGQYYYYLLFQNLFKITEPEWIRLFDAMWFPFLSLRAETVEKLLVRNRNGWNIDDLIPEIAGEVATVLKDGVSSWGGHPILKDHVVFLDRAWERYCAGDYISSISILFPRIEGILRTFHVTRATDDRQTTANLVKEVMISDERLRNHIGRMLPERFRRYLTEVFFANFDPKGPKPLSRHTVAHGVAGPIDFSQKGAIIGFLVLEQLSHYMRGHT